MDKYEYKLKAEEIIRLAGKKQYKAAAKIADEIRWEKVRNIQMLCTVSEIYERVGKYDESKEVLLLAYNRSPNGKTIVYRLVDLSIALKDYREATEFYHEYMQLAPNDSNALILKYKLYKGKGGKLETLIAILEDFKNRDYQEEWILELARLYHQAGEKEKCVDICNEIDLWFNEGRSVIQALEIKKMYEPLTPMQEKKLQNKAQPIQKSSIVQEEELKEKVREPEVKPQPVNEMQEVKVEEAVSTGLEQVLETEQEPMPMARPESGLANKTVEKLSADMQLAETIIQMARPKQEEEGTELKRGFSILPKEGIVTKDSDEFAFNLPNGVEEVELFNDKKAAVRQGAITADEKEMTEDELTELDLYENKEMDGLNEVKELEETEAETEEEEGLEILEEEDDISGEADEETPDDEEEKSQGLFGKMFSKLKMEDDELDNDFDDDYEDGEEFLEEEKDPMVTRGLTGQYEKVVIDDDEDDKDPLNVRLTGKIPELDEELSYEYEEEAEPEEEAVYEYRYADEDEDEEYEEITDAYDDEEYSEDNDEDEETVTTRSNKRFNFFRNTMEDDELFDEEEEESPDKYKEEVIPLSYAAKYDTLNLQKELAKSIQQLMDATEKETVDSTLENVKKMVEESHIPELTETMRFKAIRGNMLNKVARRQAEKLEQARDIEEVIQYNAENEEEERLRRPAEDASVLKADARPKPAMELAIKLKPAQEEESELLENILTQEDDGQLSILMPEKEVIEEQIDGQLSIDDVLREWEKQELLSENDKEKRALEEARKRALEETQGIMMEIMGLLKDVIPKISSIKDGEEKMSVLAESLERVQKSLPYAQGIVAAAEESREAASAIEAACAEAVIELAKMEEDSQHQSVPEMYDEDYREEQMALHQLFGGEETLSDEQETVVEEALESESQELTAVAQEDDYWDEEEEVSEELLPEIQDIQFQDIQMQESEVPEEGTEETEAQESFGEESQELLNEEQKSILAYFLAIPSIKSYVEQLVKRTEYAPEHMIVMGGDGSGKTSLAMRIIKAAQVNKEHKIETIAKIQSVLLNQKKVTDILEKVNGGVLIIEKAGSLTPATVCAIENALYSNRYYVQIIFADTKEGIAELLSTTNSFINDIQMKVDLPAYSNNELAEFAKTYADVNGYVIDGMAILALHSVIELFQTDQHVANLEDVKNIMDEAMERADKRTKKLFGKLFGKKNTEGIVLIESDFE